MEFEKVLQKRLKGMAVRILANIEHTLGADLGDMKDNEEYTLKGADLNIIRSEILNAAGDTTRSLAQLMGDAKQSGSAGVSFSRDIIASLNKAHIDIVATEGTLDDIPTFRAFGDFNLLIKIRNIVGAGIVYDKSYTCVGIDNVVDSLIPFLDSAQIAGIRIANGDYMGWRDAVCEMYLDGVDDE